MFVPEPRRVRIKTKYIDQDCFVIRNRYMNNVIAIGLIDPEDGNRVATASVNSPDDADKLGENETFIKDYGENEGMLKALQDAKIVGPVRFSVECNHIQLHAVSVLF